MSEIFPGRPSPIITEPVGAMIAERGADYFHDDTTITYATEYPEDPEGYWCMLIPLVDGVSFETFESVLPHKHITNAAVIFPKLSIIGGKITSFKMRTGSTLLAAVHR